MEHDDRPWGSYDVVDAGPGFQVKRLVVKPGKRFSYQRHRLRSEHWYVVTGAGIVTLDGEERPVGPGDAVDIAVGAAHRAENTGTSEDLVLIEVQTGPYFGEDDIIRLDDDYGRCPR
jgi:mannose-6-phosphate isomerase